MPYTYLIGWSQTNKWYYGLRYSAKSTPSELWKTYFTSSKYVKEYREKYGEPDVINIRKTFLCQDKARHWEHKVIKKMKMIHNPKWLNRTDNISIYLDPETRELASIKSSITQKGRPGKPAFKRNHSETNFKTNRFFVWCQ